MDNLGLHRELVTRELIGIDVILEWREHRTALKNGRASTAEETPVIGPLSHERSLKAAVKYVLKKVGFSVSPSSIRSMLQDAGFPVTKYRNSRSCIHPTLRRLVAKGCVREVLCEGQKEYEWIGPG